MARLRYVVLHHSGIARPHFDLMLQTAAGSSLATWRVGHWPPQPGDHFTPLGDHRHEYLEYEGPISGNRGRVRRIAAGEYHLLEQSPTHQLVVLDDGRQIRLPRLLPP